MKRHIIYIVFLAIVIAGVVLTIVRYDAWFVEQPEPSYSIGETRNEILTYGFDTTMVISFRDSMRTANSQEIITDGGVAQYHVNRVSKETPRVRRILVLGDIQDQSKDDAKITNSLLKKIVAEEHPDLILQTGDLIERPVQCAWDRMAIDFDSIVPSVPLIVALGNHDYHKGLRNRVDLRALYAYPYFGHRKVKKAATAQITLIKDTLDLFIIDSNRSVIDLFRQSTWLKNALDSSTAKHKILISHHPFRSSKSRWNNLFVRLAFETVAKRGGVKVLFAGHEHTYLHTDEEYHQVIAHFSAKDYDGDGEKGRHYVIVDVEDNVLNVRVFNEDAEMIDNFFIK